MNRYPVGSTATFFMSIVEAGVGVPGEAPTCTIRRVSDGFFYDDSLASGSRFAVTTHANTMTEVDLTNFPGLYRYDFNHTEDTTGSESFLVAMSNVGVHPAISFEDAKFGDMKSAMLPSLCNVYGTLLDLNSEPVKNAQIRATIIPNTILSTPSKPAIGVIKLEDHTANDGSFSLDIIRGLTVRLQIPYVGYDRKIVVPDMASANFADL